MREEALSCGVRARDFIARGLEPAQAAGEEMLRRAVWSMDVLGRGSSDHAGTVLRYAMAQGSVLHVGAAMPSVAAYGLGGAAGAYGPRSALVAISQSGRSPDLLRYAEAARTAGAFVIGLINTESSPLGALAGAQVPLCAGQERAVAATKSTVMAVMAGLGLVAGYTGDAQLLARLRALPDSLDEAAGLDWSALTRMLAGARAIYVLGRGTDLGIASEIALKIAEAVGVPALAFSSAEFLHGPLGAVSAATPVLGISSNRAELGSVAIALERARQQPAPTLLAHGFAAGLDVPVADLPLPRVMVSAADCVPTLVAAYLAIEAAALAVGRDPDRPRGLSKITETL